MTTQDTSSSDPVILPTENGGWTAPVNVERVNATEPTHRRPDPTARILTSADNGADPTPVGPPSLGESRPGHSPVDYDGDVEETHRPMTAEEFEAQKLLWFSMNPEQLPEEPVATVAQPTALMVTMLGVQLFALGFFLGVVATAVLQYVTA